MFYVEENDGAMKAFGEQICHQMATCDDSKGERLALTNVRFFAGS